MTTASRPRANRLAEIALFSCPVIWGTTFPLIRLVVGEDDGGEKMGAWTLLTVRFAIAVAIVTALVAAMRREPDEHASALRGRGGAGAPIWKARLAAYFCPSMALGFLTYVGFGSQTVGLTFAGMTASKSALLTGLFVVFTPILSALLVLRAPAGRIFLAALISIGGTMILTTAGADDETTKLGPGLARLLGSWSGLGAPEALTILCAVTYAAQIITTEYYAIRLDALYLTVGTLFCAGLMFLATMVASGETIAAAPLSAWLSAAYLGVVGTGLCFALATWGQRHVPAARAAIIFSAEPLFGTFFSIALLGEDFSPPMIGGGALIMLAIYLSQPKAGERTPLEEFLAAEAAREAAAGVIAPGEEAKAAEEAAAPPALHP